MNGMQTANRNLGSVIIWTAVFLLASRACFAQTGNMSQTCQFTQGPKAGQTINFAGQPGVTPAPVGGPCTDGMGSYGVAVADASGSSGNYPSPAGGQSSGSSGMSTTCHFDQGPKAGQTIDFAGQPGV